MPDPRRAPSVQTIPVHRHFADALVTGLIRRHGDAPLALAHGLILVPNNRARVAIADAFVRAAAPAIIAPRIVAVGDIGDDATLSALFDRIDAPPLPPAIDPMLRRFLLARMVEQAQGGAIDAGEALRLARALATTLDQLYAAELPLSALSELTVAAELSDHWQRSLHLFRLVADQWPGVLASLGRMDLADRRNRQLQAVANAWRDAPPPGFVVAAGITSSAVAIGRLLHTVARLPDGTVVLPGLDVDASAEQWAAIRGADGVAGLESHPQHQFAVLLDAIGVARAEVQRWPAGDGKRRVAARARAVANAFAPADFTREWRALRPTERALPGVRAAEFATPAEEAQGIAIAIRRAIEEPGRTVALVTPDRALAMRVSAHLRRWGIVADDTAGRPLEQTTAGTLILAMVRAVAEAFAPVPLMALAKHPLVAAGEGRLAWLDAVRTLDRALRGPRPAAGLDGVSAMLADESEPRTRRLRAQGRTAFAMLRARLDPVADAFAKGGDLPAALDAVREGVDVLTDGAGWDGDAGRAAAALVEGLAGAAIAGPRGFSIDVLEAILRDAMRDVAIRPPQGGHPRVAIRGLIEARLQSADLVILGAMNEGSWPATPAPDPWLAPRIRSELRLDALDRRIGFAAHDLAAALGSDRVLLTRSARDGRSKTIASRFWLRLEAMLNGVRRDAELPALVRAVDARPPVPPAARPAPAPPAALRPRKVSVTEIDRIRADPYAYYASAILKLAALDPIDATPGPSWRGSAVHRVLEEWAVAGGFDLDDLVARTESLLDAPGLHPMTRLLWGPRLVEAMGHIASQLAADLAQGRTVVAAEARGALDCFGVTLTGRADRIDRQADGSVVIVDYKTGSPPSPKLFEHGYALQLGLLGHLAQEGAFPDMPPARVGGGEYWSLSRDSATRRFGKRFKRGGDTLVADALRWFEAVAASYLTGDAPFDAAINPDLPHYSTYDQLSRVDEWYGR